MATNIFILEGLHEKIDRLQCVIEQLIHKEYFFLSKKEINLIKKGRDDYEYGKSISTSQLLKNLGRC